MARSTKKTPRWLAALLLSVSVIVADGCGLKGPPLPALPSTPDASDEVVREDAVDPSASPTPPMPYQQRKKRKTKSE